MIFKDTLIAKLDGFFISMRGDGTVLGASAFALSADGKHALKYLDFADFGKKYDHGELVTRSEPIKAVVNIIKGIPPDISFVPETRSAGLMSAEGASMADYIEIKYESDQLVTATVFDDGGSVAARASGNEYFGFDGRRFEFTPIEFSEEGVNASIYMPNQGYRIEFTYGDAADDAVDFTAEVSTLVADGWRDTTVINVANITVEDGVLSVLDGTAQPITSGSISSLVDGEVTTHYTDWNLPSTMKVDLGEVEKIALTGA
jgi:hypothetical protein